MVAKAPEAKKAPGYEKIFQCTPDAETVNDLTGGLAGHETRAIKSAGIAELLKSEQYRQERAIAITKAQEGLPVSLKFDLQNKAFSPADEAALAEEARQLRPYGQISLEVIGVPAGNATRAREQLEQPHRIGVVTHDKTCEALSKGKGAGSTPYEKRAA